jgi:hypothetical protein
MELGDVEVMKVEPSGMDQCLYEKDPREHSLLFYQVRTQQDGCPQRGLSPDTESASTLILDFLSPRRMRKSLWFLL